MERIIIHIDKKLLNKSTPLKEKLEIIQRDFPFISKNERSITCLTISNNKQFILAGGDDGNIRIWNTQQKCKEIDLEYHIGHIRAVELTKNNLLLFSGGYDGRITSWDMNTRKTIENLKIWDDYSKTMKDSLSGVRLLTASNNNKFIAAVDNEDNLRIWGIESRDLISSNNVPSLLRVSFTKDDKLIVLATKEFNFFILKSPLI